MLTYQEEGDLPPRYARPPFVRQWGAGGAGKLC